MSTLYTLHVHEQAAADFLYGGQAWAPDWRGGAASSGMHQLLFPSREPCRDAPMPVITNDHRSVVFKLGLLGLALKA